MKLRLLTISALMATALFAQGPAGPGGFGGRRAAGASGTTGATTTHTPPTAAQMAANQLTMIARFLRLNSADTSTLTGNAGLAGDIEAEQATLQTNAAVLKTAYSALATDIATNNTKDASAQESAIETANNNNFQARVTAASKVVLALPGMGLSVTLTPAQLTSAARLLIGGGGGHGFGHF